MDSPPPAPTGGLVNPALLASKRVVHIGGLAAEATAAVIRAACIPFGDIKSVDLPMDYAKGTHRGFAFVEFEDAEDAEEAIFNLDGADMLGRTITVSVAQPNQINKLSTTDGEAVWKSDEWFQKQVGNDPKTLEQQRNAQEDKRTLQET